MHELWFLQRRLKEALPSGIIQHYYARTVVLAAKVKKNHYLLGYTVRYCNESQSRFGGIFRFHIQGWKQIQARNQEIYGTRHEVFSPARTLGSLFRDPVEARMSLHFVSMLVLPWVGRGLKTRWSPIQGALPTAVKVHTFQINSERKHARGPNTNIILTYEY
jgi:hypothetical protein